ncbi:MAG: hypothetical protein ACRC5M_06200 [Anaeroplasmataceae bacterium]
MDSQQLSDLFTADAFEPNPNTVNSMFIILAIIMITVTLVYIISKVINNILKRYRKINRKKV